MPWSVVVFGWPFAALAGVVFLIAFPSSRRWLGFAGSALAAPFCFLVGLYPIPMGRYGGPIALATNFISAWPLYRGRREIAFAFLVPFMMLVALMALLVLGQRIPRAAG
jgi:hypothetical protein